MPPTVPQPILSERNQAHESGGSEKPPATPDDPSQPTDATSEEFKGGSVLDFSTKAPPSPVLPPLSLVSRPVLSVQPPLDPEIPKEALAPISPPQPPSLSLPSPQSSNEKPGDPGEGKLSYPLRSPLGYSSAALPTQPTASFPSQDWPKVELQKLGKVTSYESGGYEGLSTMSFDPKSTDAAREVEGDDVPDCNEKVPLPPILTMPPPSPTPQLDLAIQHVPVSMEAPMPISPSQSLPSSPSPSRGADDERTPSLPSPVSHPSVAPPPLLTASCPITKQNSWLQGAAPHQSEESEMSFDPLQFAGTGLPPWREASRQDPPEIDTLVDEDSGKTFCLPFEMQYQNFICRPH